MKSAIKVSIITAMGCLSLHVASATTVKIEQSGIIVLNADGTTLNTNLGAKAGYWASGFNPTLSNIDQWDENFISVNGSYAASTKKYSVSFTMNDAQTVGGTQTAASATGTVIPAGTLLYLIGSNSTYNSGANTNLATFNSYIGASSSSSVFILTDASWVMRTGTLTTDPSSYVLPFTANTGLATFGGTTFGKSFSFDTGTGTGTLQLVPEPSTGALMLIGAFGLVAMRRLRKA
jgi:hypothetical protein